MKIMLLLCVLMSSLTHTVIDSQQRAPQMTKLLRYKRKGDVVIAGIFGFHRFSTYNYYVENPCGEFDIYTYPYVQAIMFAIQNANRDLHVLPNITVGIEVYDSCGNPLKCLESTFWFLSGKSKEFPNYECQSSSSAVSMVAEFHPGNSVALAQVLGLYRFPQVSYGTEDASLSDHVQFPSFLRSIPSNVAVLEGVIKLLLYYKWTWVSILVPRDSSAEKFNMELKRRLINADICIELFQLVPLYLIEFQMLVKEIKTLSSKVLIASISAGLLYLQDYLIRENISGFTWIGLNWWPQSALYDDVKFNKLLQGMLWFTAAVKPLAGFRSFLYKIHPSNDPNDVFLRLFWEVIFGCKWPKYNVSYILSDNHTTICTGAENFADVKENVFSINDNVFLMTYTTFNAVSAIVYALHELQKCTLGEGPFSNGSCAHFTDFQPWQLFHYLRNVHVTTYINDTIFFTEEGYMPMNYYIANWQVLADVQVKRRVFIVAGTYFPRNTDKKRLVMTNKVMWHGGHKQPPRSVCSESCIPGFRKVIQPGKPTCCFECILCAEGEIANHSDSTDCLACRPEEWPNEMKDKCIQRATEFLSYNDFLGVALTFITVMGSLLTATILIIFIRFNGTPVVKANNYILSYLLLVTLMICFSCSFIFIGYPNGLTCRLRQAVFGISFVLSVSCVLAKTIMVVVAFNATKPNSKFRRWVGPELSYTTVSLCTLVQIIICVSWIVCSSPFPEQNFKSQPGMIILECNEGSIIAFWCMLGYMGVLAGICFVVAFLSRNLPDSFNESKFISFSMTVFVSVWLGFIPAYLSTKGKYMVAVEVFAIFASSAGLLACIFIPKCFIILMRPDMNTKAYLMGKGTQSR